MCWGHGKHMASNFVPPSNQGHPGAMPNAMLLRLTEHAGGSNFNFAFSFIISSLFLNCLVERCIVV